jgi:tol-pal system protein YbgF
MRVAVLALIWTLCAGALPAQQAETLADIKQDMSLLYTELQRLKQELNTTGASDVRVTGSTLDRVDAIETALQRVTSKAEELEFRIDRVVRDGTNRLGDLDFRLCELEPDCDLGDLGGTPRLGGETAPPARDPVRPQARADEGPAPDGELAVAEQDDFRAAQAALEAGDSAAAATRFAAFRETYPGSPLEPEALVGEGRALEAQGNMREAARRYLTAYSDYPDSGPAPEALWRLGTALGALGSGPEACVTLLEVSNRYPASDYVARARTSREDLECPPDQ